MYQHREINHRFTTTAVLHGNLITGHYRHFGIHAKTASLYGDNPKDIVEITMKVSPDQTKPDDHIDPADYWGWYDYDQGRWTMIYPQRLLLDICFPCGIRGAEEAKQGVACRLIILEK